VPLTVVEPQRLYRRIADQIAALIDAGEYAAGSRLPAERELASTLGVSRTSLREAIISLEIAGRVEVRVGNGIFVRDVAPAETPSADEGPSPFDLLSARSLIEGEIARTAARAMGSGDIAALRATIDTMKGAGGDFARGDDADRRFHLRIAESTQNGALVQVVADLWDARRGELWARIEHHFQTPELRSRTIVDHAAIVDALAAGDGEAARDAMHRHLARVAREFQRSLEPQAPGRAPGRVAGATGTRPRTPTGDSGRRRVR